MLKRRDTVKDQSLEQAALTTLRSLLHQSMLALNMSLISRMLLIQKNATCSSEMRSNA